MEIKLRKESFNISGTCSWVLEIPTTVYPPREDTYLLADTIIKLEINKGMAMEIGCGSGALSLLLAHLGWDVLATDINPYAVLATRINATNYGLMNNIQIYENCIENGIIIGSKVELIIWNLPYLNPLKPDDHCLELIEDAAYIDINDGGWCDKLFKYLKGNDVSDHCVILLLFRTIPESASSPLTGKINGWSSRLMNSKIIGDEKLEVHAFWKPGYNSRPLMLTDCESTMDEAKKIKNIGWNRVMTDKQYSGRGRRGSVWDSQEGDMMATWIISKSQFGDISIGLIQTELGSLVANALGVDLKWPNDIISSDFKKLGGIIMESGDLENVVRVGVGINRYSNKKLDIDTAGWSDIYPDYNRDEIFSIIDAALSSRYEINEIGNNFNSITSLDTSWEALSRHISRGVVNVIDDNEYRVTGLNIDGSLNFTNDDLIISSDSIDEIKWKYFIDFMNE